MTTAYPTSVDSFNNPSGTDKLGASLTPHADQHININDAMAAVQNALGTDPQGGYLTVKARLVADEAAITAAAAAAATAQSTADAAAIAGGSADYVPVYDVDNKTLINSHIFIDGTDMAMDPGKNLVLNSGGGGYMAADAIRLGYATTATAAGTTALVNSSKQQQFFTGTTTQTVTLPVTSGLVLGQYFRIVNNSTGVVTVQSSGANTVQAMDGATEAIFTCILTSGTTAASWDVTYIAAGGGSITGSGTAFQIPMFTGVSAIGDSPLSIATGAFTLGVDADRTSSMFFNALDNSDVLIFRRDAETTNADGYGFNFAAGLGDGTGIDGSLTFTTGNADRLKVLYDGSVQLTGTSSAPSLSTTDNATLFYNNSADALFLSKTGGAYFPIVTEDYFTTISDTYIPKWLTSGGFVDSFIHGDDDNTYIDSPTIIAGAGLTTPILTLSQTWNSVGTTFTGFLIDIANTTSASGSLPFNVKVNGTSQLSVGKTGEVIGTQVKDVTSSGGSLAKRDINGNILSNNFAKGYATNVTAAGTTTIGSGASHYQVFTGSTTQTVTLPVVSSGGVLIGQSFTVVNQSSGSLTVNSSGGNLVKTITTGDSCEFFVILLTGTTAASWAPVYYSATSGGGGITGSGTINYIPLFDTTGSIADSIMYTDGDFMYVDGPNLYNNLLMPLGGGDIGGLSVDYSVSPNVSLFHTDGDLQLFLDNGLVVARSMNTTLTVASAHEVVFADGRILCATVSTYSSNSTRIPLTIAHGTTPTSPPDGAFWSETTGFYGQVNGSTVGPFGTGGGGGGMTSLTGAITGSGSGAVATSLGSFTFAQLNTAVSDADLARTDAANTFTGVQTMTAPVMSTPVINGIPIGTGVSVSTSSDTLVLRDPSGIVKGISFFASGSAITSAAGTSTMLVNSAYNQIVIGSTTQTIKLPVASTLYAGWSMCVSNSSSGLVTVVSSGTNTIRTLVTGESAVFTCVETSLTTAAGWATSVASTGGTITSLTGDVTASGSGAVAATVVKINGVSLAGLATGILKNTTTTGAPSIAVAGDFPTLNQSTTGSAATLTTPRAINGVNFDGSAAITVTAAAGTLTGATLASGVTASSLTSFGTSPTLVTPILGTPTSGTLTNCTGLPISTGVSGLGTNVATFLATPSSANLLAALTTSTGTGSAVFGTAPTIAGGAITALTGLAIRSTGAAFDLTFASSEVLTAGRTLSFILGDAARSLTVGASASVSGSNTGDQTNISGNAATVTTNANLTGHITSTGNATLLGSFTFAQLNTAVSDADLARTDSANTFTGVQTMTSPALTTPAITGLATGSGVASAATASTLAARDANGNLLAAQFLAGYATTATAAGTTTLVVGSAFYQFFTGSTTQTVTLPVASTLALGQSFYIQNNSTGVVTVQSSGSNSIIAMAANSGAMFTCILTSGTSATSWSGSYTSFNSITGTGNNVLATSPTLTTPTIGVATATSINKVTITAPATGSTLTIPDGVTMTGPAASGTVVTLGNAETIAGVKTFNDGSIKLSGATSGASTLKAPAIASTYVHTLPAATDTLVGLATTDTLTNKRVTQRVTAITSSGTPTINTDNCDAVDITALAAAITSMTTNLTGTPSNKDTLVFEIKDNGTARSITWGASFVAGGVALPTTTVISKILTVGFMYSTANGLNKWRCIASAQEA